MYLNKSTKVSLNFYSTHKISVKLTYILYQFWRANQYKLASLGLNCRQRTKRHKKQEFLFHTPEVEVALFSRTER